jgi:hypothetical protein
MEIIAFLCEHPDPTRPRTGVRRYKSDPYTMSINTVRGNAFHALFSYVWCDRHQAAGPARESRIPDEVKRILEDHLQLDDLVSQFGLCMADTSRGSVYDRKWASV